MARDEVERYAGTKLQELPVIGDAGSFQLLLLHPWSVAFVLMAQNSCQSSSHHMRLSDWNRNLSFPRK